MVKVLVIWVSRVYDAGGLTIIEWDWEMRWAKRGSFKPRDDVHSYRLELGHKMVIVTRHKDLGYLDRQDAHAAYLFWREWYGFPPHKVGVKQWT